MKAGGLPCLCIKYEEVSSDYVFSLSLERKCSVKKLIASQSTQISNAQVQRLVFTKLRVLDMAFPASSCLYQIICEVKTSV